MANLDLLKEITGQAQRALEPGFQIYDISATNVKKILRIRILLDKINDPWGTPSIADCSRFSRACSANLADLASAGKLADDYHLEVSSPGAERELRNFEEWQRFQDKPMKVRYDSGGNKLETIVANFLGINAGKSQWKTAELKRNRKLKKVKENNDIIIDIKDIKSVRLYLDF
ncbi:MAG: hypothetical protein OEV66_12305 [Spirochaetia bacterium]|nr:hypothetical protein [Spirochaetia bacterium]